LIYGSFCGCYGYAFGYRFVTYTRSPGFLPLHRLRLDFTRLFCRLRSPHTRLVIRVPRGCTHRYVTHVVTFTRFPLVYVTHVYVCVYGLHGLRFPLRYALRYTFACGYGYHGLRLHRFTFYPFTLLHTILRYYVAVDFAHVYRWLRLRVVVYTAFTVYTRYDSPFAPHVHRLHARLRYTRYGYDLRYGLRCCYGCLRCCYGRLRFTRFVTVTHVLRFWLRYHTGYTCVDFTRVTLDLRLRLRLRCYRYHGVTFTFIYPVFLPWLLAFLPCLRTFTRCTLHVTLILRYVYVRSRLPFYVYVTRYVTCYTHHTHVHVTHTRLHTHHFGYGYGWFTHVYTPRLHVYTRLRLLRLRVY